MAQVNKQQNDWETLLGFILSGYRSGIQNSTRPSELLHNDVRSQASNADRG